MANGIVFVERLCNELFSEGTSFKRIVTGNSCKVLYFTTELTWFCSCYCLLPMRFTKLVENENTKSTHKLIFRRHRGVGEW